MAKAHFNLGNAFFELGDYLKAAESYKMATNADPNYAKAYYFGAECWLKLGDIDAALAEWLLLSKIDEELAKDLRKMIPPGE